MREYRKICAALVVAFHVVGCASNRASAPSYTHKSAREEAKLRRPPASRVTDGYGLPSSSAWVCEVEASEKIFTGIGSSKTDALDAALNTCASHLQASYCQKTECKTNL